MKKHICKSAAAVAAAVLLTSLSATAAFAADPTVDTDTVTFTKALDMNQAQGAGGINGEIKFDIAPGTLPSNPEEGAVVGTTTQLKSATVSALFTADSTGQSNTTADVDVEFDLNNFEHPGIYYYTLKELDPEIAGLTPAKDEYTLKVSIINADATDPNAGYKVGYAILEHTENDEAVKTNNIVNTYETHTLTVEKELAGDFADYSDDFQFVITLTDPDGTAHMAGVTVQAGDKEAELLPMMNGSRTITETIKGGQSITVSGLPEGTTYTIEEQGRDAQKYTTTWSDDTTGKNTKSTNGTVEEEDIDLTVTNTRNAPPINGLVMDAAPYGVMLALAAGGGLLAIKRRRSL